MVSSLNEVYEKGLLHYWCNSTGGINMPGYPPMASPGPETLPPDARNVYDNFWEEGAGAQEYVVTYNGETGLMLGWLFDYSWLADIGVLNAANAEQIKTLFHKAVKSAAETLVADCADAIIYGRDTDPDGDEILLFISSRRLEANPHEVKRWIDCEGTAMGEKMYKAVEAAMMEGYA